MAYSLLLRLYLPLLLCFYSDLHMHPCLDAHCLFTCSCVYCPRLICYPWVNEIYFRKMKIFRTGFSVRRKTYLFTQKEETGKSPSLKSCIFSASPVFYPRRLRWPNRQKPRSQMGGNPHLKKYENLFALFKKREILFSFKHKKETIRCFF